jgi:hypothetical protein
MWLNDVEVNDKPKFLTEQGTEHDHAICVVNHEMDEELVICQHSQPGNQHGMNITPV